MAMEARTGGAESGQERVLQEVVGKRTTATNRADDPDEKIYGNWEAANANALNIAESEWGDGRVDAAEIRDAAEE
jgi:hypothetical protein